MFLKSIVFARRCGVGLLLVRDAVRSMSVKFLFGLICAISAVLFYHRVYLHSFSQNFYTFISQLCVIISTHILLSFSNINRTKNEKFTLKS
jgi:hypothetical protein